MDSKKIISKIEQDIDKPMVTAKFGDNWREHAMKMYDIDNVFEIAWRQGRKAILLERELVKICNLHDVTQQRELLINFLTFYQGDENSKLPEGIEQIVDIYLKN